MSGEGKEAGGKTEGPFSVVVVADALGSACLACADETVAIKLCQMSWLDAFPARRRFK